MRYERLFQYDYLQWISEVVMDLSREERMSDSELVELALRNGVDLRKYII